MGVILVIGIILMSLAGYLYYKQEAGENKRKQTISNTTEGENSTESMSSSDMKHQDVTTEETDNITTEGLKQEFSTTTEKKQTAPLPDNYEWDEERWGEPPQIVYDFAENQKKFEYIVSKIDSIVSKGNGFVADSNGGTIYYDDSEEDIKDKNEEDFDEFIEDIKHILKNTKFYNIVKKESGNWIMEYNQEEDRERYIYYIAYAPEMTEDEAWENGYMKVVGDLYFATLWKI